MKKILSIMLCMVLLFSACPVQNVNAEENTKTYHMYTYDSDTNYRVIEFTVPADALVFGIHANARVKIVILHDGDRKSLDGYWTLDDKWYYNGGLYEYSSADGEVFNTTEWISAVVNKTGGWNPVQWNCYGYWQSEDVPMFENFEQIADYISTGNEDGWLNKPKVDYSGKHNFSNDEFLTTIPLPQLSSISHLGFTVDNLPDDMFIDVVAEFNFYGQHMKDDKYCTDYNWLYDSAQYDFTKSDFANNNPVISIKDFYDINPVDVYWSFFEKWSAAYPNLKDIPGYAWYNFTLGSQYIVSNTVNDQIDYSTESGKLSQLIGSNALETVYYIRFYNDEGHAGQWMKFAYRDKLVSGLPVGSGSLISGAVSGSTPTGKPIVDTTINGDIDSDGNINFNSPTNDFTFNTDMDFSNFTYLLETSANVLQQFPLFISQLFLFLPWWVNALIACAIAMCILLRIVGR